MMVKLDALEEEIDRIYDRYLHPREQHPIGMSRTAQAIGDILRHFKKWGRANSIDAVPVVRCRDCFYSRPRNRGESEYLLEDVVICENCEMLDSGWNPMFGNDFCSYGKRKGGDE